ncbi:MAG: SDR family NAD(P)-dependent oxidoreductase [Smithellaceae bacterium]|nr:SDR family NAD(P)-dependent oxidoreductase [Smithellaceae bacterium]
MVSAAVQKYRRVDIMINNAGLMPSSLFERLKIDDWNRMIDVNIKGVPYGIAAVLPYMKKQEAGHIINVSSVAGHKIRPGGRGLCGHQACRPSFVQRVAPGSEAFTIFARHFWAQSLRNSGFEFAGTNKKGFRKEALIFGGSGQN